MVAKSYQGLDVITDVYTCNGRTYVKVRDLQGNVRQVRWYTDKEYEKMYGEPAEPVRLRTQKSVMGFDEGFITIFKGDTYAHKEEFKNAGARYTRMWGWGLPGGLPIPEIEGVTPIRLDWEKVCKDEEHLKTETQIQEIVEPLLYDTFESDYVGTVGERLRGIFVTVVSSFQIDSFYGTSTVHDFVDEEGHYYSWITSAKTLPEGTTCWLDGTVKDHKLYKGVRKTILTRCRIQEEIC